MSTSITPIRRNRLNHLSHVSSRSPPALRRSKRSIRREPYLFSPKITYAYESGESEEHRANSVPVGTLAPSYLVLCADDTQDQVQSRRRSQRLSFVHTLRRISRASELDGETSDSEKGDISDNEIDHSGGEDIGHSEKGVQADDPRPPKPDVQPLVHTSGPASEHIIDLTIEENLLARIADLEKALSSTKQELSAALKGRSSALKMGATLYGILLNELTLTARPLSGRSDLRVFQAIQDINSAGLKHDWEEAVRESGDGGKT